MADLFWFSDERWAVIEPFMPTNQPGACRVDDRKVISGIVHVLRSGYSLITRRDGTVFVHGAGFADEGDVGCSWMAKLTLGGG